MLIAFLRGLFINLQLKEEVLKNDTDYENRKINRIFINYKNAIIS